MVAEFIEALSISGAVSSVVVDLREPLEVLTMDDGTGQQFFKWPSIPMAPPFRRALYVGEQRGPRRVGIAFELECAQEKATFLKPGEDGEPVTENGVGIFRVRCLRAFAFLRGEVGEFTKSYGVTDFDFLLTPGDDGRPGAKVSPSHPELMSVRPADPGAPTKDETRAVIYQDFGAMVAACALFHVKNQIIEDTPPPRHARRRAEASGRSPQSWKTLRIIGSSPGQGRSAARGEAHRALHLVRGHFAAYTEARPMFGNQKNVGDFWITDHMSGSREFGVVGKDYAGGVHRDDTKDLYLFENAAADAFKIGKSKDPDGQRMDAVLALNASAITLVAVLPGGGKHETRLHHRFDTLRIYHETPTGPRQTEWFRRSPEILEAFRQLGATFTEIEGAA